MKIPAVPGWQPLPEDPDFVFLYRDGLLMHALHSHRPQFLKMEAEYQRRLEGPLANSFEVDRWLLADLTAQDFENAAREVQSRLTDEVIDRALRQMPAAWYTKDAPGKLAVLKARRAALVEYVQRVYRFYAKDVDVHASDQADDVAVSRAADDAVEVSIARQGAGAPYYRRRFLPAETGNVRIYLHAGDDHVTRTGRPGGPILIRVIAGSGHDVIDDTGSGGTEVWKDAGSADVRHGDGTRVVGQTWVNPHPVKDAPWIEPRSFGHWTAPAPDHQLLARHTVRARLRHHAHSVGIPHGAGKEHPDDWRGDHHWQPGRPAPVPKVNTIAPGPTSGWMSGRWSRRWSTTTTSVPATKRPHSLIRICIGRGNVSCARVPRRITRWGQDCA